MVALRRCEARGGPTMKVEGQERQMQCVLPWDHQGPHQAYTMVGTDEQRKWEWG